MPKTRSRVCPAGFTLVELLVVLGIIAVLISVLLPTLSRARESANRTQCLSNLRQIAVFMNMYANQFRQQVPLGMNSSGAAGRDASEGNNYNLTRPCSGSSTVAGVTYGADADSARYVATAGTGAVQRYVGLGLFIKMRYVREDSGGGSCRVFFCPTFQGDQFHAFDAQDNKWPPAGNEVRCTYSSRASTSDTRPVAGSQATDVVTWGYGATPGPFYTLKVVNGQIFDGATKSDMFKLNKLKNRAIVCDVVSSITRVRPAHRKGINVLYASGGATWVDQGLFMKQLNTGGGGMFNIAGNWLHHQIWNNLDAGQQLY